MNTSKFGYIANVALSVEGIDAYMKSGKRVTPTGFALAVGLDPNALDISAADDPVVMYALFQLRAYAEGYLFEKVTGAVEYIKIINDIISRAEVIMSDGSSGMEFKSA